MFTAAYMLAAFLCSQHILFARRYLLRPGCAHYVRMDVFSIFAPVVHFFLYQSCKENVKGRFTFVKEFLDLQIRMSLNSK